MNHPKHYYGVPSPLGCIELGCEPSFTDTADSQTNWLRA